eukprot:g5566.t1 g5566   contig2:806430-807113(+)
MSSWFAKKEETHGDYLPTVNAVPVPQPNHQYTTPPSTPLTSQSKPSPIEVNANHDFFLMLGRHPAIMAQCPKCSLTNIRTRVKTYPSLFSWLFTVAWFTVCMLGYFPFWWIIFAFFPFFYDGMKRSDHYCSKCNKYVGCVKPLSDCGVKHRT